MTVKTCCYSWFIMVFKRIMYVFCLKFVVLWWTVKCMRMPLGVKLGGPGRKKWCTRDKQGSNNEVPYCFVIFLKTTKIKKTWFFTKVPYFGNLESWAGKIHVYPPKRGTNRF